jgi:hypothetical protein
MVVLLRIDVALLAEADIRRMRLYPIAPAIATCGRGGS